MKRNYVLVLGLGILLGAGLLAPGCGSDSGNGSTGHDGGTDAKLDGKGLDGAGTGGVKGTGGALGSGGAVVDGGNGGALGTGGAVGNGGATGTGGAVVLDGGVDSGVDSGTVVTQDGPTNKDADLDVPLPNPDGPDAAIDEQPGIDGMIIPQVDTGSLDGSLDVTPVSLDAAVDVEIDSSTMSMDADIDGGMDADIDGGTDI